MTDSPEVVDLPTLRRLVEHLPQGDDISLIVLKGHLLIEERLLDLVGAKLGADDATMRESRLRFAQLIPLARAASGRDQYPWLWAALGTLNALRNDLAHHIEPKDVQRHSRALVAALGDVVDLLRNEPLPGQLRGAVAYLYGALMRFKLPKA